MTRYVHSVTIEIDCQSGEGILGGIRNERQQLWQYFQTPAPFARLQDAPQSWVIEAISPGKERLQNWPGSALCTFRPLRSIRANPVKTGGAKLWVYRLAPARGHDCQAAENVTISAGDLL